MLGDKKKGCKILGICVGHWDREMLHRGVNKHLLLGVCLVGILINMHFQFCPRTIQTSEPHIVHITRPDDEEITSKLSSTLS